MRPSNHADRGRFHDEAKSPQGPSCRDSVIFPFPLFGERHPPDLQYRTHLVIPFFTFIESVDRQTCRSDGIRCAASVTALSSVMSFDTCQWWPWTGVQHLFCLIGAPQPGGPGFGDAPPSVTACNHLPDSIYRRNSPFSLHIALDGVTVRSGLSSPIVVAAVLVAHCPLRLVLDLA
jgi:hypothetical protein